MSSRAPGARVPRSTADQPPPSTDASGERNAVTLGPRDRLVGTLHIEGDLRLGGIVEGGVEATGDVEIDDEAKVNASVAGRDVSIRGQVSGPVTARKRLMVAKTGSLNGDVRVARLVIQDGASFSGNVSMGPQAERAATPPVPDAQPPTAQDGGRPSADAKPIRAAEPEKPIKAAEPEKPIKAAEPVKPIKAAEPVKPIKAAEPVKPIKAAEPDRARAQKPPPGKAKPKR